MARRLDQLEQNFLDTIKQNNLINKGDVIVVGVSGGPDSITLLTCLNKFKEYLKIKIICAHVNHMIRKDSTDDEQFVEKVCEKMGIQCYVKRVEVEKIAKEQKKGTEEVGRKIRYEFFDEVAKKENANKIAIAHNMNDNAETMLMNIIRGCGMQGLEGIQSKEYGKYIRPLINCKREIIEEYCEKNNLHPRIDSTNKENIYRRNIIRNKILPEIKEINPNIVENLSRLSQIIKTENLHIKNEVENIYNKIGKEIKAKDEKTNEYLGKIELELCEFQKLDLSVKQNLILFVIDKLTGSTRNIEKINIDDIIKICDGNIGNKYILINKKCKVMIENKKIIFIALT